MTHFSAFILKIPFCQQMFCQLLHWCLNFTLSTWYSKINMYLYLISFLEAFCNVIWLEVSEKPKLSTQSFHFCSCHNFNWVLNCCVSIWPLSLLVGSMRIDCGTHTEGTRWENDCWIDKSMEVCSWILLSVIWFLSRPKNSMKTSTVFVRNSHDPSGFYLRPHSFAYF